MSDDVSEFSRQLQVWLDERRNGFAAWAQQTGLAERWDFTAESLDVLEKLVRSRYRDEQEIAAGRLDTFLQGAIWYVGEAACRSKGLVWRYWPFNGGSGALPDLFGSGAPGVIDTPSVAWPRTSEDQGSSPLGLIFELFWTKDDIDRPIESHLRDILDFRLSVLDDDPAEDGIDWVDLEYHDFDRFRQAVSDHLEPDGWGSRFPVLLQRRDALGCWTAAAAAELEAELLVVRDELAEIPAPSRGFAGQADVTSPVSLLDVFVTDDGDGLVDRLIRLARTAYEEDREITFR